MLTSANAVVICSKSALTTRALPCTCLCGGAGSAAQPMDKGTGLGSPNTCLQPRNTLPSSCPLLPHATTRTLGRSHTPKRDAAEEPEKQKQKRRAHGSGRLPPLSLLLFAPLFVGPSPPCTCVVQRAVFGGCVGVTFANVHTNANAPVPVRSPKLSAFGLA